MNYLPKRGLIVVNLVFNVSCFLFYFLIGYISKWRTTVMNRTEKENKDWMKSHEGQHVCRCGCGEVIKVQKHHLYHGIPEYVRGHWRRGRSKVDRWIEEEQGKHFCQCGCGTPIKIMAHHHTSMGIARYINGHGKTTKGYYYNTLEDFWNKVNKEADGGCWEWTGSKILGYGSFYYRGKRRKCHRLSYRIHYGNCKGMDVCHRCDNPACVNPDHLFLGTHQDNMTDAKVKLRMAKKYTSEQVLKIVELVDRGMNRKEAAREVGMSHALAVQIMNGWVWGHVTGLEKKERKRRGE